MPRKRVYKCTDSATHRLIWCGKERAGASCLTANIVTGGKCPALVVSHVRMPARKKTEAVQRRRTEVPPLSASEKERLIHAVGTRCCYPKCRETVTLEVHHIIPRSEGGTNRESNLVVLCPTHHSKARGGTIPRERLRLHNVKRIK